MKLTRVSILVMGILFIGGIVIIYTSYQGFFNPFSTKEGYFRTAPDGERIKLPEPAKKGTLSVEEAIVKRRSVRDYSDKPLKLEEVSQILWSAQGITEASTGKRAAPSAGATYPMELYLLARHVENLKKGVYRYRPEDHSLVLIKEGEFSKELEKACVDQASVGNSAVNIIITAVFDRTTERYGKRGEQYVYVEAGHIGQNIYLQAEGLNLGTVMSGAFTDKKVKEVLSLPENHVPLAVMPVGRRP